MRPLVLPKNSYVQNAVRTKTGFLVTYVKFARKFNEDQVSYRLRPDDTTHCFVTDGETHVPLPFRQTRDRDNPIYPRIRRGILVNKDNWYVEFDNRLFLWPTGEVVHDTLAVREEYQAWLDTNPRRVGESARDYLTRTRAEGAQLRRQRPSLIRIGRVRTWGKKLLSTDAHVVMLHTASTAAAFKLLLGPKGFQEVKRQAEGKTVQEKRNTLDSCLFVFSRSAGLTVLDLKSQVGRLQHLVGGDSTVTVFSRTGAVTVDLD